jgi:hypothetical protein
MSESHEASISHVISVDGGQGRAGPGAGVAGAVTVPCAADCLRARGECRESWPRIGAGPLGQGLAARGVPGVAAYGGRGPWGGGLRRASLLGGWGAAAPQASTGRGLETAARAGRAAARRGTGRIGAGMCPGPGGSPAQLSWPGRVPAATFVFGAGDGVLRGAKSALRPVGPARRLLRVHDHADLRRVRGGRGGQPARLRHRRRHRRRRRHPGRDPGAGRGPDPARQPGPVLGRIARWPGGWLGLVRVH